MSQATWILNHFEDLRSCYLTISALKANLLSPALS